MHPSEIEELAFIITGDLLDQSEHWLEDEKAFIRAFFKCIATSEGKELFTYLLNKDIDEYLEELNVRGT